MAFSGKYEIFKYSCSPGFQKYAIENRFEKSWFTTELWSFPYHQVGMSFYWLFGTYHVFAASALYPSSFEPSSFSSSLTGRSRRTQVSADAQGHFLRSKNWKRLMLMTDDWCAAQSNSHNACNISSAPLRSDGLERRISGKAPRPWGCIYSQTRSMGPERPTPLHLGPTKTATHLASHVESASALSALKKSLVASLSAKRQLSVAKLSAKRIFSLAKRDFLVANGRMAADFSSPVPTMRKMKQIRGAVCSNKTWRSKRRKFQWV